MTHCMKQQNRRKIVRGVPEQPARRKITDNLTGSPENRILS